MNRPLISIIIPVYNAENYLAYCLDSILRQKYNNIEIILINDGSTDNSLLICKKYADFYDNIKFINQENHGASYARNVGLKFATGELIGFVDSDDYIDPMMYENMYNLMIKHDGDLIECEIDIVNNHNNNLKYNKKENVMILDKDKALKRFFRANGEKDTHTVCNKLIKRNMLNNFSFIEGVMNEDILALYEIINNCDKYVYTSACYYHYYMNKNGVTNKYFNKKHLDLLKIWEMVLNRVDKEHKNYIDLALINYKRAYFTLLAKMFINGYKQDDEEMICIKKFLKKKVRLYYFDLLKWNMTLSRKLLLTYLVTFF